MSRSLRSILSALDYSGQLIWGYSQVEAWPSGELEHCLATGLFVPAETATEVYCGYCGETADARLTTDQRTGAMEGMVLCGPCGPYRVPLLYVSRWQLDFTLWLERLCEAIGVTGTPEPIIPHRVWRLGKCRWTGATRSVYLARRLTRPDAYDIVQRASFTAGAVGLVPCEGPSPELRVDNLPTLIRLTDVLSWQGAGFAFDHSLVADQLHAGRTVTASSPQPSPAKRTSRLSVIERLTRALTEHLRAARDHALTTRQRGGSPEYLPRPTQEFLARQLGVNKATVSRCLEDDAAGELRRLWDAAGDIGRLVD